MKLRGFDRGFRKKLFLPIGVKNLIAYVFRKCHPVDSIKALFLWDRYVDGLIIRPAYGYVILEDVYFDAVRSNG